ncbi:acyl-coenzyme A thioesterase THEM4 isoform X2 [Carcharodon carcharias]|uniref:acyl-coenzyme A thioesterase THEM4 isoform X2 n=1 Tax=Carcharodon carcharias TaxID=13397 RepID=UPI001B7E8A56|nr:acyl-coenzyme A thioesterase THEM4 isoform X2 [Carcharodon carcharias]
MMRLGILNRLCRSAVFCSDWTVRDGVTTTMLTLVRNHHVPSDRFKDYGIPNASWNPDMMALYRRYMAWTEDGSWKRLPSYNRALRQDRDPESPNRLFTRNTDVEGSCFEYAMFLNASERRILCIFQPGPLLEGPPCHTHGGAIFTLLDGVAGTCAYATMGPVLTANVNVNFQSAVHQMPWFRPSEWEMRSLSLEDG